MAGSDEFKEELSRSARNKQIREEIGNDPERLAERISGVDREAYDFDGYTDKQINMALQGDSFGDEDYARLTGKPIGGGDAEPDTPPAGGGGEVTIPTPTPDNGFGPDPIGEGGSGVPAPGLSAGLTMNIEQNNPQTSTVTGNNNTVTQNQDNSIRGFAGGSSWKNAWMRDYFA